MNETASTFVHIGGVFHILLAAFHLLFWQLFEWRRDLGKLSFINRGIMQILNLCLTFVFLSFAWVSIVFTTDLLTTGLGRALLLSIALFWVIRAMYQIAFFRLRHVLSNALFIVFLIGAALYAYPLWVIHNTH